MNPYKKKQLAVGKEQGCLEFSVAGTKSIVKTLGERTLFRNFMLWCEANMTILVVMSCRRRQFLR